MLQSGHQARRKLNQLKNGEATAANENLYSSAKAKINVNHLADLFDFRLGWITAKKTHKHLQQLGYGSRVPHVTSQLKPVVSKLRCWVRKLIRHRLNKWCEHMWSKDCKRDPPAQRKGGSPRSKLPGSLWSFPHHWNLLFHVGLAWSESRTRGWFAQGWQSCSLKSEPIRLPMETWEQAHQEKFSNTFILVASSELWWKAVMRENTLFLPLKIIKILKKH